MTGSQLISIQGLTETTRSYDETFQSEVLSLKRNMNAWKVDFGDFITCFCEGLEQGVLNFQLPRPCSYIWSEHVDYKKSTVYACCA